MNLCSCPWYDRFNARNPTTGYAIVSDTQHRISCPNRCRALFEKSIRKVCNYRVNISIVHFYNLQLSFQTTFCAICKPMMHRQHHQQSKPNHLSSRSSDIQS